MENGPTFSQVGPPSSTTVISIPACTAGVSIRNFG